MEHKYLQNVKCMQLICILATYTPYIIPVCFVVEEYVNGSVFPLLLEHEIELLTRATGQIIQGMIMDQRQGHQLFWVFDLAILF